MKNGLLKKAFLIAIAAGIFLPTSWTLAAESANPLPTEMLAILRNAKVVDPQTALHASMNGHEAIITTKRNAQAKDKDCKIDAIMLGKALMDNYPELLRVKVLFSDYEEQKYTQVSLSKGDIVSYGSGKMNQDDFLNSLEMTTFKENVSPFAERGGESGSIGVVPGPMQDKRLLLLARIQSLKQKGTNVKLYLDFFQTVEDAAKAGDETKVQALVTNLSGKLNDQEKAREQANATGVQMEVLRFQTQLKNYIASGRKLPFDMNQVVRVQQLVVAGRNSEAKALLQILQQKLH